ncbi:hypothetical protein FQA39_LY12484 [Lamprigera yunnana]|nr:hypothetical protein FQA39_LY12484 [Lamprigera yunnana]
MNLQLWDDETLFNIEVNDEGYNRAQNGFSIILKDCETQNPEIDHEDIQSSDEINNGKWSYNENLAIITTMENYLNEINHSNPKKKKDAWSSISSELETLNITKTADCCRLKWKNLPRSYSNYKTNCNKTGRKPTRFLYFEEMDQLVDQKPNYSSPHSFNVLFVNSFAGTSKESSPSRPDTPSTDDTNESTELTPRNKRTADDGCGNSKEEITREGNYRFRSPGSTPRGKA